MHESKSLMQIPIKHIVNPWPDASQTLSKDSAANDLKPMKAPPRHKWLSILITSIHA